MDKIRLKKDKELFDKELSFFNKKLNEILIDYSQIFLLVDENTFNYCYPLLKIDRAYEIILIESGEENKTLESCQFIWNKLLESNADRESLLINLGGGVITDMGGFAASTYKRGIDFINIPTTLLSLIDATIGGKTAIDFLGQKNMIGLFVEPKEVLVNRYFLNTLSTREIKNGFAEVLKHGLILDKEYLYFSLQEIKKDFEEIDWNKIIEKSMELKTKIVKNDFKEIGIRKILNFGHTLGHALETYSLKYHKNYLKHGEAVILGMIFALRLSVIKFNIDKKEVDSIIEEFKTIYDFSFLTKFNLKEILNLINNDKKSSYNKILFILLKDIGDATFNNEISKEEIELLLKDIILF